jgi:uncharacterized protein YehS (DUF1456 family)
MDGRGFKMRDKNLNNQILKCLKVALELSEDDVWQIWNLGGVRISKSVSRCYFTGITNKNYRICEDEDIQRFMNGLIDFKRNGLKITKEVDGLRVNGEKKDLKDIL